MRRDAERNRGRIIAAARVLIAAHGLGVSYDEIARSADVAVGTVYDRFPRRDDLVDAAFGEQVEEVVDLALRARTVSDPWDALVAFLTETLELQANDRGLRELASGTGRHTAMATYARQRVAPVAGELLARAQESGVVRSDIGRPDLALVPIMVGAIIDSARARGRGPVAPRARAGDGRPTSHLGSTAARRHPQRRAVRQHPRWTRRPAAT